MGPSFLYFFRRIVLHKWSEKKRLACVGTITKKMTEIQWHVFQRRLQRRFLEHTWVVCRTGPFCWQMQNFAFLVTNNLDIQRFDVFPVHVDMFDFLWRKNANMCTIYSSYNFRELGNLVKFPVKFKSVAIGRKFDQCWHVPEQSCHCFPQCAANAWLV